MVIRVKDARVHPSTGYMEVDVCSVRHDGKSEVLGPIKTYGIDTHILKEKYNGDIDLWLAGVRGMHETHMGHHEDLSGKLLALKGKEL